MLSLFAPVAVGQKQGSKVESAEHAFARKKLEENKQTYAMLQQMAVCLGSQDPDVPTCPFDVKSESYLERVRRLCSAFQGRPDCLIDDLSTLRLRVSVGKAALELLKSNLFAEAALTTVDECARIYRVTIDKKRSDLTTRQADRIKNCKEFDLYPPPAR